MKRKTILHVIDSLGVGGAEILYVHLLPELSKQYQIVLVTLTGKNDFEGVEEHLTARYVLDYHSYPDIFSSSRKLNSIIKKHSPDLVHCHLYWSTIIGRLACPADIPFYFSVHATMDDDPIASYKRFFIRQVEKITYRRRQRMIGVTEAVIESFKKVHPRHGQVFLLHNYVRDEFFSKPYQHTYERGRTLRLITVSNIRLIKNIPYLIEVMNGLKDREVALDIYGDGPMRGEIAEMIAGLKLENVKLMGRRSDIAEVMTQYDAFISPSTVEGFGIAVAEAMSIGLPLLLSSLPVYREVAGDKAIYIDNRRHESLRQVLLDIMDLKYDLKGMTQANRAFARERYSKSAYLSRLNQIYQTSM